MKKNYEKPQIEVVRMEQVLLSGSITGNANNAGLKETFLPGNGTGASTPRASEFFDDGGSEGW